MQQEIEAASSSRELIRAIRQRGIRGRPTGSTLPESHVWQIYCELRQRGEPRANGVFLQSIKSLHRRRSEGTPDLPNSDPDPSEHRLVDDPMLGELWRAYKRCICAHRVGPAGQLLRDIEDQLEA